MVRNEYPIRRDIAFMFCFRRVLDYIPHDRLRMCRVFVTNTGSSIIQTFLPVKALRLNLRITKKRL